MEQMSIHVVRNALAAALAAVIVVGGALPAMAENGSTDGSGSEHPATVSVGKRTFDSADGVEVTRQAVEIDKSKTGTTVGVQFTSTPAPGAITPFAVWGSSYATSTEYAYLLYRGAAKAGANVYSGKRIIQVCIQYTRGGVGIADKRCSTARSTGSTWVAGGETLSYATDSLGLNDPHTILNIWTTRVNPNVY